jgi:hypothetical protein
VKEGKKMTNVEFLGKTYTFTPHEVDLSEQNGGIRTECTHKIEGFEEPIYLIFEQLSSKKIDFYFGMYVGDTNLLVNVSDTSILIDAGELVIYAVENNLITADMLGELTE